ncbi:hypothetical protein ACHAXS_007064 [Conticribra weissflogii]
MSAWSNEFKSHDAFEAALRRYCHPAAVADLDALPRGGKSWKNFLEAFGMTCRDNLLQFSQRAMVNGEELGGDIDRSCPLVRAMVHMGGRKMETILSASIVEQILMHLRSYGRPIPSKFEMMAEHSARVTTLAQHQNGYQTRTTSNNARKNVGLRRTAAVDWSTLRKVNIRDLKLYDSDDGTYVEGTLLVDPFTPMVGTTTILEDGHGDVVLVACYNFLPDGVWGPDSVPLAAEKGLGNGNTIRIKGAWLKLFRDGSRGIRIDDPNDIFVVSDNEAGGGGGGGRGSTRSERDEDAALSRAKDSGNDFFRKKMYLAAAEAYLAGMRKATMVPILLSNRSQAFASAGKWEDSLADAAASLAMRPGDAKTRARYRRALETSMKEEGYDAGSNSHESLRVVIGKALLSEAIDADATNDAPIPRPNEALRLKEEGNAAFGRKRYAEAIRAYTLALRACGETSRALLGHYSLCCLHYGANLDAVAASAASIRVFEEPKAVCRLARALMILGEPRLCRDVLAEKRAVFEGTIVAGERDELMNDAEFCVGFVGRDVLENISALCGRKLLPRWVGAIEAFDAGPKGRGVRSKMDLTEGSVVLIEPPVALSETDGLEGKRKDVLFSLEKNTYNDPSQAYLRQAIVTRSQREGVLAKVVDHLYDGSNHRPVVSFDHLIPSLTSCPPLLPSHSDYFTEEKVNLTSERIGAIVSVNSHGRGGSKDTVERFTDGNRTSLFPATSMFNHSPKPTCFQCAIGGCTVIFLIGDVKAGDELTLCYHPNEEIVKRHWGF